MRSAILAFSCVLASAASLHAQPAACPACDRGDELIARFELQPLRELASELAALQLASPLGADQYAKLVELRRRHPALARLGALDDLDLQAIAATLCQASPQTDCRARVAQALLCLAERCEVALPASVARLDAVEVPEACTTYKTSVKRETPLGVGLDWATGWQRSQYPTDGRAWSFGITTRLRLGGRLGAVARVDRIAGRDEAIDNDGDGHDDVSTGSITRITALAGPSILLDRAHYEGARRFVRLDLLAGYMATLSQPAESGLAAGVDLSFQVWILRLGARVIQGFAGAGDATVGLVHMGFAAGASPLDPRGADCDAGSKRRSRFALGLDWALGGLGVGNQLEALATGIGFEASWYLSRRFDAVTRADMLLFPGDERERVIHQALLAGVRIDHGTSKGKRSRTGFFTTWLGGYTHEAGLTPSTSGTGPIVDGSVGWGIQSSEAAANFRLHARFGVSPDNSDYRAFFLSAALELRFDPTTWRPRL